MARRRRSAESTTVRIPLLEFYCKISSQKWLGPESNRRHADFQSAALPTELPSRCEPSLKQKTSNAQRSTFNVEFRIFVGDRWHDATSSNSAHAKSRSRRIVPDAA